MRGEFVGSAVAHVALLGAMFVIRAASPILIPGPEVVQVALVEPGPIAMPAVRQPKVIRSPEVAPEEDEGVRIEKPKAKAPEPKTEPEPPPKETPSMATPALDAAAMGPTGLQGDVSLDAADFEFTYYLVLVRNRIAQNWSPPAGLEATPGVRAVVYFRIQRNGALSGARVESASPQAYFDRAALRAVLLSDPLPPLPLGYPGKDLGVHFGFQYTGP
jgi:TonB family protein